MRHATRDLIALCAVGILPLGCGKVGSGQVESVANPQTEVKSQGATGFCWAYTAAALVEANAKKSKGLTLDLSEESLGYEVLAFRLKLLANKMLSKEITEEQAGLYIRDGLDGVGSALDGLQLIQQKGILPEFAWSQKFHDDKSLKNATFQVNQDFFKMVRAIRAKGQKIVTDAQIQGLLVPNLFTSAPPQEFVYSGKKYTPLSYANEVLEVNKTPYQLVEVRSRAELLKAFARAKRVMAAGFSVPLSLPLDRERMRENTFGPPGDGSTTFRVMGRHALLVTDFVNTGGNLGKSNDLSGDVAADPMMLEFFYAKNSWGRGINEFGMDMGEGYYKISRDYLLDAITVGKQMVDFSFPESIL